jgi:hypothetical protein
MESGDANSGPHTLMSFPMSGSLSRSRDRSLLAARLRFGSLTGLAVLQVSQESSSESVQCNLKQNHPLLVAIRGTRAIVAGDANTNIFMASREFTKKNSVMEIKAAPHETESPRTNDHAGARSPSTRTTAPPAGTRTACERHAQAQTIPQKIGCSSGDLSVFKGSAQSRTTGAQSAMRVANPKRIEE